jgi:hypothetical protein
MKLGFVLPKLCVFNVSIRPRTYCQPRDLGVSLMAKKENDTINI